MARRLSRATTKEQKDERRKAIIDAANEHLAEAGFEAFSMEVLAKELGYARGTLYRYFGTREEVLLALYNQHREDWVRRLIKAVKPGLTDQIFIRRHFTESMKDPLFLTLRSRLESVIVKNISEECLQDSRELTLKSITRLSEHYTACLGLDQDSTRQLIIAYGALMLGAVQVETQPVRVSERLPKHLNALVADLSGKAIFESNALMILEGLRARGSK